VKIITPNWPAPATIKACTTLRTSWVPPKENIISLLALPSDPVWLKQIHSTNVVPAEDIYRHQEADASYTNEQGRVCLVLTADCLPILICNRQGTHIAAIHAGWRGLAKGIIENTIQSLNLAPEDIFAWMGPAIGPQKFEVGIDVYQAFTEQDAECTSCFSSCAPNKWLANLYQLASKRLNNLGITQIYGGEYCTHTQQDLFFSYRRDGSSTGRMASLIWIDKK
jgi:YfiH family protein